MKLTLLYSWLFNFLTVYSSNMGIILAFPLILAFLSSGQTYNKVTEQKWNSCYELCPPGYYKTGNCNDTVTKHKCEKCGKDTYTAIPNYTTECERCGSCGNNEVEVKPCTSHSNVVCDCKTNFYYKTPGNSRSCRQCDCKHCDDLYNHTEFIRKCTPCESCLDCKKKCAATPSSPPPTKEMPWLFVVVVLVILLVFLLLLLFCTRNPESCLRWSAKRKLELPVKDSKCNKQSCHQDRSSGTQTFNISKETLTMTQSPAIPEHPALISPLLPDAEHKAARQDEQLEHWPAIVLYAIIKEVPLRRWKEFLRLLSVADQQLERVELEAGLGSGSMERQYQMLRLWSQRASASLNDVFSALHYMDLSGCAQLLQESLEKLLSKPELKQGFTASRSYTDHGFSGDT